ncbi:hypothetical protein GTZ99_06050 [Novosphingobium sp. FSY-8]|uniref:Uncharacterized protein n=1 Tax=Novosphingobium ovatum TaxID=1908523 RepID=A0ABW9XC53_9SPHN|nr:hypothetical protein [Novosphingobium ovatum]NBC36119.1 hypothetical protein [Novosphingobium ovatum]
MTMAVADPSSGDSVESGLALALARGDAVIGSAAPVLRHLLVHDGRAMFGDDVLARLRAMMADLAHQVVDAMVMAAPGGTMVDRAQDDDGLIAVLPDVPGLLGHLHGLALEWHVTQKLQERLGLDPVLAPLVQALIASGEAEAAGRAMRLLAAQARFAQGQRRMQLSITELPAELLHGVLVAMHVWADGDVDRGMAQAATGAERALRACYDEGSTRIGLTAALVSGMGAGALAALNPLHAGVAIFASALAQASGQGRDTALLSMQEGQTARLGLGLRAAGLNIGAIEAAISALHPQAWIPPELARLPAERAAQIIADSSLMRRSSRDAG